MQERHTKLLEVNEDQSTFIKVIGVGGGGSNAVNHMHRIGIKNVEFVVCNTDRQALMLSPVEKKIQLGADLLEGLGAGTMAERGRLAAEETVEYIQELMEKRIKMVFITAGMGGGTGTGAAPVIAREAKAAGMLTVAVVTAPYNDEGSLKKKQAIDGINLLKEYCDTVLVVLNDKLEEIHGGLPIKEAHAYADNVLANAVKSIAEVITKPGEVNTDFMDVKTVLEGAGTSVMSTATAVGEDRALKAIAEALESPLLNNKNIKGAKRILVILTSSDTHPALIRDRKNVVDFIRRKIGKEPELVKPGISIDETLGEEIMVTVVAAGFKDSHVPFMVEDLYADNFVYDDDEDDDDVDTNEPAPEATTPEPAPEIAADEKPRFVPFPEVFEANDAPPVVSIIRNNDQKIDTNAGSKLPEIIVKNDGQINIPKAADIEPKKEEPAEDPTVLERIKDYILQHRFTTRDLEKPAYLRQGVVLLQKNDVPETEIRKVTLDKNKPL